MIKIKIRLVPVVSSDPPNILIDVAASYPKDQIEIEIADGIVEQLNPIRNEELELKSRDIAEQALEENKKKIEEQVLKPISVEQLHEQNKKQKRKWAEIGVSTTIEAIVRGIIETGAKFWM